jgi:hypothetical protein
MSGQRPSFSSTLVEISDDLVAVEGLVSDQPVKTNAIDERSNAHRVEAMTGQKNKAYEISKCARTQGSWSSCRPSNDL